MTSDVSAAEQTLFNWLAVRDPQPDVRCDAVIGFGHFDLAIPRRCAELVREGRTGWLIFSGGIGAGTGDLGGPEADAFREELKREHCNLAAQAIIENRSTNTGDNIRFISELLRSLDPPRPLGDAIRSVLLVATPCRQRRVWLTWRKLVPEVAAWNSPPMTDYDALRALYASKGEDIRRQLVGEYERIRDYPGRGWIADGQVPLEISQAAEAIARDLAQE